MTTPMITLSKELPMYYRIVSEKNGKLELHNENLLHVLKSVDGSQVKENFPVAILSVFGTKESDKLFITKLLIQKLQSGDNKDWLNTSMTISCEQDQLINGQPGGSLPSVVNTDEKDEAKSSIIHLWSQPFVLKMGVHSCMKPLIIWIVYFDCTQETSRKPLENFLLKVCSKIIDVNRHASEISALKVHKRLYEIGDRRRSIPLCSSFFYIMRSNEAKLQSLDAKTTHEIFKIMRKHFPKQTKKYMNLIQCFSYFGLVWVDDNILSLHNKYEQAEQIKDQAETNSIKSLTEQILDRSKLEPKRIGKMGQSLTLGKMADFLSSIVDELNSLQIQPMQNNKAVCPGNHPFTMSVGDTSGQQPHRITPKAFLQKKTPSRFPLKPVSNTVINQDVLTSRHIKKENKISTPKQRNMSPSNVADGRSKNSKTRDFNVSTTTQNTKKPSAKNLKGLSENLSGNSTEIIHRDHPILNDMQRAVVSGKNSMQQESQAQNVCKTASNYIIFHLTESSEIIMALNCRGQIVVQSNTLNKLNTSAHIALTSENIILFGSDVLDYADPNALKWHWNLNNLFENDTKNNKYKIPLEESDYVISSPTLLGLLLKQLKEFLENNKNAEYYKAIVAAPSWISKDIIAEVEAGAHIAGFSEVCIINESSAIAQNFTNNPFCPLGKGEFIVLVENYHFIDVFVYSNGQERKQIESCSKTETLATSSGNYYTIIENIAKTLFVTPMLAAGSLFAFYKTKSTNWNETDCSNDATEKQRNSCLEIENVCNQAIIKASKHLGREVFLIESVFIHKEFSNWPSILKPVVAKLKLRFYEHKEFDAVIKGAVALDKTGYRLSSDSIGKQSAIVDGEIRVQKGNLLKILEKIE